jgi:general secretion pathway protein K
MWTTKTTGRVRRSSGSALLAVLWLSAALAAIGFSLATTVMGETERTATEVDSLRSYYLAAGGVNRAALELLWSVQNPAKRLFPDPTFHLTYQFESGDVKVDIIPESAKLDVNTIQVPDLIRLCVALGLDQSRAEEIAAGIDDWRRPAPATGGPLDSYYLSLTPSFQAPHASIQEIEELLAVKGVTPEIFYGTYVPAEGVGEGGGPRLVRHSGLADCLSVYGSRDAVDINTADSAVLAAVGETPFAIAAILHRRQQGPIKAGDLGPFLGSIGAAAGRLRVGGNTILTFRGTAQLRLANGQLSDLKRTVAAQVKYMPDGFLPPDPIHILRWYDTAWSN